MTICLLPENPGAWSQHDHRHLFAIPREEREVLQREALQHRFARMRNKVPALQKLADKNGVDRIDSFTDVLVIDQSAKPASVAATGTR